MPRDRGRSDARSGPSAFARLVASCATVGVVGAMIVPPAAAQSTSAPASDPVDVARRGGEAWLSGRQQPDGGFALGGLPGVETPESILALAGEAQTSDVWSAREAIDRIEALTGPEPGRSALDALAGLAAEASTARDAALLVTRVALPLQMEPTAFDPDRTGRPVDLIGLLDGARTTDATASLAEVITAQVAVGGEPSPELLDALAGRVLDGGGWGVDEDSDTVDIASTSAAVVALVAAGQDPSGEPVAGSMATLVTLENDDGGWGPEESTATDTAAVITALRAVGFDPGDVCWQEEYRGSSDGGRTPVAYLLDSQSEAGHWGDPGETISTAVALQALNGRWLPIARGETRSCGGGFDWPLPAVPPALLVVIGVGLVGVIGSARILRGGDTGV